MAALMLDVMPNSSTAPSAATRWPGHVAAWWSASPARLRRTLSLSAKATTLFVCELESRCHAHQEKPMYMPMPTPSSEMEEYMSSSDPAITM